ncbi:MAG: YsnF/AvaK domain-containing protein [Rhizomicrobium sp.]
MQRRIISALYDSRADAELACNQLRAAGVPDSDIEIHEQDGIEPGREQGFLAGLKETFGLEDSHAYAEGVRRGHYLVTARLQDGYADEATAILESSRAVDFDSKQKEWRASGWKAAEASQGETIPVVEENLSVGKREINRGGVRVRSYVVEEPVGEQVNLREEHVSIQRRPVNRPLRDADDLLKEQSIEMTETAEEAVVAKDAVVREEVGLRKDVEEKTADIKDTVRRTKVEVEDTRTGRKTP